MLKEFREFAVRGNVVDMAVGIVLGGGFGKIVSSLVADVIMPPLGVILSGVNFAGLQVTLKEAAGSSAAVTLRYGAFIQAVVDFVFVAFAMFLLVKTMNRLRRKEAVVPAEPKPSAEVVLLGEIRDLLKSKKV